MISKKPVKNPQLQLSSKPNVNVSLIRGFDNPILTVMWLGFFHINASSGLLMSNNPTVRFRVRDRVRVRDMVRVEASD